MSIRVNSSVGGTECVGNVDGVVVVGDKVLVVVVAAVDGLLDVNATEGVLVVGDPVTGRRTKADGDADGRSDCVGGDVGGGGGGDAIVVIDIVVLEVPTEVGEDDLVSAVLLPVLPYYQYYYQYQH